MNTNTPAELAAQIKRSADDMLTAARRDAMLRQTKLLPEAEEALCGAVGRLVAIADEFETRAELAEQHYVSAVEERDHLRALLAQPAQAAPVAWVRLCSDGTHEGPIMDAQMEDVRKRSGAWTPLYPPSSQAAGTPAEQAADSDVLYWSLHDLSVHLESSGRIDERDQPGAYATLLDAMNFVRQHSAPAEPAPHVEQLAAALGWRGGISDPITSWTTLLQAVAELDRSQSQLIEERDDAQEWADKLADAIAAHTGIEVGEHSNVNCPWEQALEAIATPQPSQPSQPADSGQASVDEFIPWPLAALMPFGGKDVVVFRTEQVRDAIRAALASTPQAAQPADTVSRCNAVMALIDEYELRPTAGNRHAIRSALLALATMPLLPAEPAGSGHDDRCECDCRADQECVFCAHRSQWPEAVASPQAAPPSPPAAPVEQDGSVHVECRRCTECCHTGINDAHDGHAACSSCDWSGQEPGHDECPACGEAGTMSAACPDCGGRYRLIAEGDVSARAPSAAPQGGQEATQLPPLTHDALHYAVENVKGGPKSADIIRQAWPFLADAYRTAPGAPFDWHHLSQRVGYAAGLKAGADLTRELLPAVHALKDRVATSSAPQPSAVKVPDGWISVEERLPEPDTGEVLVWLTGGRCAFDEWHMHREDPTGMGGPTMDMGLMWRDYDYEDITHWQPLPAAPAAQGDEQ